jgi:signal transduction histidine kinase
LYAAAEAGHRTAAVTGAATVLAVSVGFRLLEGQDFRYVVLYEGVGHAALMTAAIMLGELVRARRRIAALTEQHITLEAERRLGEHKQALSRDLHDSIGHTLTLAAIHTSVAQQEAGRQPEAAAAALGHVSDAVSQALTELRVAVRQLRAEPPRSLRDLEPLAATARAAGFHVRSRVEPVDIDDAQVMAAVYRLVQESLTNALRHSDGRLITIDIRHLADDNLDVRIEDDGVTTEPAEERAGLTGLRERVAALGGHLDAGPAERGWRVRAALPLAAGRPAPAGLSRVGGEPAPAGAGTDLSGGFHE